MNTSHAQRTTRHKPGSTLLMALLVMSTILAIALSVGQIIFLEIVLVKTSNETVVATYAAESGLERGAYRVRNSSDTLANLVIGTPVAFSNSASWSRAAISTVGSLVLRPLKKGLTRGFDFYDPDSGGAGGRESVKINIDSCFGDEWIELGYQAIDSAGLPSGNFQKIRYPCSTQIINSDPQSSLAYRLYIRYVQGTPSELSRVMVTGCTLDGGNGVCSLPGQIDLTSTGIYRGARRSMDLVTPRLSPITGIFDYGVFSECQIIKDPTNPNPAC